MTLKETQNRIKAHVWQAIAQNEIDVSTLDKETLESLVNLVSEAAMLDADDELGKSLADATKMGQQDSTAAASTLLDDEKEDILWQGRPFLSISQHYTITDERIRITEGVLGKARENIELIRIQDVDFAQTLRERLLNVGDINIRSHDPSHPVVQLNNVKDPEAVYELLRRAILKARKRHNLLYREEM